MSDSWIRSNFRFGDRSAILVIPARRSVEVANKISQLAPIGDGAESLERWLIELIEYIRPDLKGVVLYAMDFDMRRQCWQVFASHQKFATRMPGSEAEEISLGNYPADSGRF